MNRFLKVSLIFIMVIALSFTAAKRSEAYYGLYGGLYGYGLYGLYGLYGGLYGLYGGLYGLYGGLYGMGLYGLYGLYSPFGLQNMYYPVETGTGLTYQIPFLQIAPLLGIAGLYNSLFPYLFNPQSVTAPSVAPTTTVTATPIVT